MHSPPTRVIPALVAGTDAITASELHQKSRAATQIHILATALTATTIHVMRNIYIVTRYAPLTEMARTKAEQQHFSVAITAKKPCRTVLGSVIIIANANTTATTTTTATILDLHNNISLSGRGDLLYPPR
ncbi:hypothetical protein N7510_000389 [Penicillium lagena]|uniref:uncharacterized protein n=1 Tax=Penicillium lagena TaxID=94218 RepID=UPI00253FE35B|nr:uncharacterized protein N7510_000389 [Penicillium lagena]KAJ5624080.1 hypothetical protein N7510_000389 [Penicillium lagena]